MFWGERKFTVGRHLYHTKRRQRLRVQVLREDPVCVVRSKREGCASPPRSITLSRTEATGRCSTTGRTYS
jgi:hypothetical protein